MSAKNKNILSTGKEEGINQILPHHHPVVWQMYLDALANTWSPSEINMGLDIQQWKTSGTLSDDEKLLVKRCLGFFAGGESLVSNNLLLTVFKYISDAECRQYLLKQVFEEAVHNHTVVTCCDAFSLDIKEVYEAYESIPSIKKKDDFLMSITHDVNNKEFDIKKSECKKQFLRNLITFYIICEGTFFFSGFAMLLSLGRQNKLQGLSDQIRYTLRDEGLHIKFGTYLINQIKEEHPELWTKKFQEETIEHIKKAVELEVEYAQDVLPRGILGLNSDMFIDYMQFIANRRLEGIGIEFRFDSDKNPFSWMSEVVDMEPATNFFERKVRSYQKSGSLEDDF